VGKVTSRHFPGPKIPHHSLLPWPDPHACGDQASQTGGVTTASLFPDPHARENQARRTAGENAARLMVALFPLITFAALRGIIRGVFQSRPLLGLNECVMVLNRYVTNAF